MFCRCSTRWLCPWRKQLRYFAAAFVNVAAAFVNVATAFVLTSFLTLVSRRARQQGWARLGKRQRQVLLSTRPGRPALNPRRAAALADA
jgi:hypothetical protein